VSSKDTIESVYSRIEDELRSQYNFGYTPDQTGAGYRTIRVGVKIKNLVARARQGYYASQ